MESLRFLSLPRSVSSSTRKWRGLLCGAVLTLGTLGSAQAAPPANDNFAGRFVLSGTAVVGMGNNTEATRESFERDLTGNRTLWWTWTAPADGVVTINIQGTSFSNRRFAVFNGSQLDQLTLIDYENNNTSITFPTVAGAVYQISAGAYPGYSDSGTIVLNIQLGAKTITSPVVVGAPANSNDNFVSRTTLTGPTVTGIGYNLDSSRESFERDLTGNRTLWWTWTAPADGVVTINMQGTSFSNRRFAVFNGSQIEQLTLVDYDNNSNSVTFPTVAGVVYQISAGAYPGYSDSGYIVLNIQLGAKTILSPTVVQPVAAANDNFANRVTLQGATVTGVGHPLDATRESNEPAVTGNNTVWWTWTAPYAGILTVNATGTDFSHNLTAFTGNAVEALTPFFGRSGSQTSPATFLFAVEPGATYQFAVGATNGTGGTSVINLSLGPHPSFFQGEAALNGGFYYLQFPGGNPFGYYNYYNYPYLYHDDLGFECFFDANDNRSGAYLYDFSSRTFFYTSPSFPFPYLYDFSLRTVIYYYPDTQRPGHYTTNPRYFYNYATGRIITK